MITATYLRGYELNPIIRYFKRRILMIRIGHLYSAADHFAEQIANGREGLKYAHTKLVNLECELRDLK